ncbi:MAG TPA: hypothetical protein DEQ98_13455, partial [Acidobacteria bacterium]|nr:hypothetical protein [Acidobacteriota bacterium]
MSMRHRVFTTVPAFAFALVVAASTPALAQTAAHGQPDIQGVWTNFDPTPFEAPNDIDLERLAPLAAWFPGSNRPQRPPAEPNPDARSAGPPGPWGDG